MKLVPIEAMSFSGVFGDGDDDGGEAAPEGRDDAASPPDADGDAPAQNDDGTWTSTIEASPELRVQTRRGFRTAIHRLGEGQILVTLIPDYATNLLDVVDQKLTAPETGFGKSWGLNTLLPKKIRHLAGGTIKAALPKQMQTALKAAVSPAYAAHYLGGKIPAGKLAKVGRQIARQAGPIALQAAMTAGISTVAPMAAAPGMLGLLQKAMPGLIGGAKGSDASTLKAFHALLPKALKAMGNPSTVMQMLPGAVESALPAELERALPAAAQQVITRALPPHARMAAPPGAGTPAALPARCATSMGDRRRRARDADNDGLDIILAAFGGVEAA